MEVDHNLLGLSVFRRIQKRLFDIVLATIGLVGAGWLIVIAFILASIDTRNNGFFTQRRIGRNGCLFTVVKIRTMIHNPKRTTTVTTADDPRVTMLGRMLRKSKIDELPQLWNVLIGNMSFVGPRPDVPGYADRLIGKEKLVLSVRPGITGPATLKYRNEEELLAGQADPETYNREVIFPDKVRINLEYIQNWRFSDDIRYIWRTIFGD